MKGRACGSVKSRGFLSAAKQEGRVRRVNHLDTLGWRIEGGWWMSPYTGTRFTLQTALDVEDLRGTFESGWFEAELTGAKE